MVSCTRLYVKFITADACEHIPCCRSATQINNDLKFNFDVPKYKLRYTIKEPDSTCTYTVELFLRDVVRGK